MSQKNSILQLLVTCEADLAQAQIEDLFEQLRQEKQRSWRLKEQIDAQKRFAEHANKKQPEKEQLGKGDSELGFFCSMRSKRDVQRPSTYVASTKVKSYDLKETYRSVLN